MLKLTQTELVLSHAMPSMTMSDVKREILKDFFFFTKRNDLHFGQKQCRSVAEENKFLFQNCYFYSATKADVVSTD